MHFILAVVLGYLTYRLALWAVRRLFMRSSLGHIPGPRPQSWITGNLGQLFSRKGLPFHNHLVDEYGGMVKVYGFFGDEQLYIADPVALQHIIIKDQDAYEETSVFIETNKAIFGPGLVATVGEQHARQRKLVKPAFSVPQLRRLTPLLYSIAEKLSDVIFEQSQKKNTDGRAILDMCEWMSRVALETIGQAVLGYSFDPLDTQVSNPYTSAIKELIPTLFSLSLIRQFAPFLSRVGSSAFRRKLVEMTPIRAVQKVKDMSDVMYETAKDILRQKRESLVMGAYDESPSQTTDIITELLCMNNDLPAIDKLSDEELIGQMTVLIFGAQDTTSAALSRILYMLSIRPDVQQKLQKELETALSLVGGRLGYDEVMSLPWLDAVLKETLRLYPPVPFVRRTAIKERTIPFNNFNGKSDSVTIPVGTTLFVSIAGPNRMESIWGPDAKEWKPERWLTSGSVHSPDVRLPGIYAGTMSFLGGARSCVGYKFAQIEIKILLVTLLSRFSFTASGDEIVWNLSQIISPSIRKDQIKEIKGLPLCVQHIPSES